MASNTIKLIVKNMVGDTYKLDVELGITVLEFKTHIEEISGVQPERQKLVTMKKKPMDETKTLADYGLKNNHRVFLIVHTENFEVALSERRQWYDVRCWSDRSGYCGSGKMRDRRCAVDMWVTFEDRNPKMFRNCYGNHSYYDSKWDSQILSFHAGAKDNDALDLYPQENCMTVKVYDQQNRLWEVIYYIEDAEFCQSWVRAFGGMAPEDTEAVSAETVAATNLEAVEEETNPAVEVGV